MGPEKIRKTGSEHYGQLCINATGRSNLRKPLQRTETAARSAARPTRT